MWNKFKTVNRNYKLGTILLLKRGLLFRQIRLQKFFADNYTKISRDSHMKIDPGKHRKKEKHDY